MDNTYESARIWEEFSGRVRSHLLKKLRNKADALASTANFLRGHGWQPGGGYQPGETNYGAIQGWNAASVYQQAIAIIGAEIDG